MQRGLFHLERMNPNLIGQGVEQILAPLRRVIPRIGMFDITPIVAILLLELVQRLLFGLLVRSL